MSVNTNDMGLGKHLELLRKNISTNVSENLIWKIKVFSF